MPLEPRTTGQYSRDYHNTRVVQFINAVEIEAGTARSEASVAVNTASDAQATARNALAQVGSRYEKPATGIPPADLSVAVLLANTLGTPNNPVTDPAALRPAGLRIVWWQTAPTRPTNALTGDWDIAAGRIT